MKQLSRLDLEQADVPASMIEAFCSNETATVAYQTIVDYLAACDFVPVAIKLMGQQGFDPEGSREIDTDTYEHVLCTGNLIVVGNSTLRASNIFVRGSLTSTAYIEAKQVKVFCDLSAASIEVGESLVVGGDMHITRRARAASIEVGTPSTRGEAVVGGSISASRTIKVYGDINCPDIYAGWFYHASGNITQTNYGKKQIDPS